MLVARRWVVRDGRCRRVGDGSLEDQPSLEPKLANDRPGGHFPVMSPRALRDEILQLPPAERLQLVEEIWESLAQSPDAVPVPEWHRELLDDRLTDPAEQATQTWEQVQENARRRQR